MQATQIINPILVEWFKGLPAKEQQAFMTEVAEAAVRQTETAQLAEAPFNLIGDPVGRIEDNFFIPELAGPIQLIPYQKACLREAYRQDDSGKFIYNLVLWSDIKKSGKSSIAAAVALDRAMSTKWGSIKVVANDLKQADSRVAYYLRRAIELNPALKNIKQVSYKTTLPNRSIIEAIPIDPRGEAGASDDLVIFSEFWGWKEKKAIQMWTEMTLSPIKFGYSQRWVETYAGYDGESPLLEQLYERGVKNGQQLDLSFTDEESGQFYDLSGLEVYRNGDMLCLWNTVPRCPWQTPEYYTEEESTLLPSEFNRVHRNKWTKGEEKFINIIWWDNCRESLPPLGRSEPMVLAMDAAKGGATMQPDCFAIAGVTRHPGRKQDVAVRYCGIWLPPPGGFLDFAGPEQELRRLCKEFSVIEVCYDPYQLHDMATRLKKEGVANFQEFGQQKPRLIADQQLQNLIMARRIAHDGNPLLRQHIDNANAVKVQGEGLRVVKRNNSLKIDSAVAVSMGTSRILYYVI